MTVVDIIGLLGGVALFLFGMALMGEALKKVAGNKLEIILYKLSSNVFKGIMLGTGVTAVIQSSSATSVMVVGFVNSGMMKVKQAIGVILGAILGTSITGWILCLNSLGGSGAAIATYLNTAVLTGVVAVIGIILRMFCKKVSTRNVGEILLGFAILMFGMSAMSGAVSALKDSPEFISALTHFSNPFLGILAGIIITSILQSASAAVGIVQALAVTGAVSFGIAFPLIMGIGIGASVPVLLSSLGASVNGKRTAFSYLFIDVFGAIICGAVFYILNGIFKFTFLDAAMTMVSIALVNTLFRLATLVVLSPAVGLLEKVSIRIFPDKPDAISEQADMEKLETRFLEHPALAIEQSRLVIESMAAKSKQNILEAIGLRGKFDNKALKEVFQLEEVIDRYEDKLGKYLSKITENQLNNDQMVSVSKYLHALSDFERISDHGRNIGEVSEEINEKKVFFSSEAESELMVLEAAVTEIVNITFDAFVNNDRSEAERVEPLEEVIDELCDGLKFNHINRIREQKCSLEHGFIFNDLLTNYERVSDHCSNVAIAVLESSKNEITAHEYVTALKDMKDNAFNLYLDEYREKYRLNT